MDSGDQVISSRFDYDDTGGTLLTTLNNSPPGSFFFRADLLGKDKGVVYYLTNLIKR